MSEYSILETLYLIPLSIDGLICSLTIGIFSCVKAPDHIKAFRMLQIAIIAPLYAWSSGLRAQSNLCDLSGCCDCKVGQPIGLLQTSVSTNQILLSFGHEHRVTADTANSIFCPIHRSQLSFTSFTSASLNFPANIAMLQQISNCANPTMTHLCSLSMTIILSYTRPVFIPSFIIISANSINFSQTELLVFAHTYFFLTFFHVLLHLYNFFLRCLAISSPEWKIRVRRIFSFFFTNVFLLVITFTFHVDYLVIPYQINENNATIASVDCSVLINDSNFPLTLALFGLLVVFAMSWSTVIVTLLYKLPHLGPPLSIKIQTMHQQLLRVSLVQINFLATICVLPWIVLALSTFVQDKQTKQILSNALMITTLHSSGNCLIVLFVTKYYRDLFIKLYQRLKKRFISRIGDSTAFRTTTKALFHST